MVCFYPDNRSYSNIAISIGKVGIKNEKIDKNDERRTRHIVAIIGGYIFIKGAVIELLI